MKLKKIDVYILRKFLGTFVYCISLISVIIVIFDISEKIEDFIGKHAPLKAIVFDYYFNFIPFIVNLFSPLFTFIAVIFFTSQMASRTEIVAILGSGVSFKRLLFPYMLAASVIASFSLVLNHFVIPKANRIRIHFEDVYIKNRYHNDNFNIHRQISPGTFMYVERYDNDENRGYKFSLEQISDQQLHYKLLSDFIQWDSIHKKWQIHNYYIRKINSAGEKVTAGIELDTTLNFVPKDFGRQLNKIETMSYHELNSAIKQEKMLGTNNVALYEIEKYKRTAFPFATFILTIIGVSLASRKVRGGIGLHIGLGLLISFSFILFMQVSTTFAASDLISPFIAVWIPNILFGILALLLLRLAPK
ncbi:MAG: LptF/LptG family permease [Bacteroidia bacterium]